MTALTDSEVKLLNDRFNAYDTDGSGSITQDECKKILTEFMSDEEVKLFFDNLDLDKDGRVTKEEFEKANS